MKRLKLGKTSCIFLSVGVFVVAIASLGVARSQQLLEQAQIEDELSISEMRINSIQVKDLQQQQEELQEKLEASTTELTAVKDRLRQSVVSADVIDEFFAIAYSCDVWVTSISSSSIKSEKLEDIDCSTTTINAAVAGEVPNLISFVIKLNGDFTTGIVKSTQMSILGKVDEGKSTANILMVVYAYEGD